MDDDSGQSDSRRMIEILRADFRLLNFLLRRRIDFAHQVAPARAIIAPPPIKVLRLSTIIFLLEGEERQKSSSRT